MSQEKPSKAEISYNAKNSFGQTYDDVVREVEKEARFLANDPDHLGKDHEELKRVARNEPYLGASLGEFQVKDPRLAREWAGAEDEERTRAAALRLVKDGAQRAQFNDKSSHLIQEKVSRSDIRTGVSDIASERAVPASVQGMAESELRGVQKSVIETANENRSFTDKLMRKKINDNGTYKASDIGIEATREAKEHEAAAEDLGEQAAKEYLKTHAYSPENIPDGMRPPADAK